MAKSDGSVIINTLLDTQGFGKGVKSMKGQMNGLTSAIGKLGAAIGLAFGVKALVDFGKSAIDLGSDLQEVQNVVDVTFSTMNEAVNEFARNAAQTAGLSETMAKRYTGTFGAMAKAFGFAESEAFDMATSLTQLSGDVASFYNLTQDEAYTKLKSVFTGETESLKDLGVVMTQTALDSFAMAKGYGKTTKEMSEQEKVALRYAFVLDQLSASQGDFVRTSDSWANQTRVLSLNFDTLKANIGQALINIFTPFLKVLNQIVDKMAQLSQRFVEFSEMLVGKSTSGGGGSPGETVEEIAQGFDDVTDATKEAEKAQKSYLGGLDEIRTFSINDTAIEDSSFVGVDTVVNTEKEDVNNLKKSYSIIDNILDKIVLLIKNKDWNGLGEYLTDGIVGALDFLSEKLDDFDWEGLGEDIGDFLAGIDWVKIIKTGLKLKINIWEAIADVWFGSFDAAPIETSIMTALALLKFTGLGALLGGKIKKAILGTAFATAIIGAFASLGGIAGILTTDLAVILGAGTFTEIAIALATGLGGAILTAILGYNLGEKISVAIWPENKKYIEMSWKEQWKAIFDSFKDGSFIGAFELIGEDIAECFTNAFEKIKEAWTNLAIEFSKWQVQSGIDIMDFIQVLPSKVPGLATGAVIPPNAPFMAMLGDQRHGTNIEAPLETIKQAVAEVVGNSGGGQYAFTAQINRRTLFEEMIDEAKLRQSTSGRNPFDLI